MPIRKGVAPKRAANSGKRGMMMDRPIKSTSTMTRMGRTRLGSSFSAVSSVVVMLDDGPWTMDHRPWSMVCGLSARLSAQSTRQQRDADEDQGERTDDGEGGVLKAQFVGQVLETCWNVRQSCGDEHDDHVQDAIERKAGDIDSVPDEIDQSD